MILFNVLLHYQIEKHIMENIFETIMSVALPNIDNLDEAVLHEIFVLNENAISLRSQILFSEKMEQHPFVIRLN